MPCGPKLVEAVSSRLLTYRGKWPAELRWEIDRDNFPLRPVSIRSIRYAIAGLIRSGRARRDGKTGPVFAVRQDND